MSTSPLIALVLLAVLATGCAGDEQETAAEFCAEFQSLPTTGFGTQSEIVDTSDLFQRLEASAPEEIAQEVETVAEGLSSMLQAFADVGPNEGVEQLQAVQEAADVDLDELGRAAERVQEYAVENCEGVEAPE